jgi:hypothetical protein
MQHQGPSESDPSGAKGHGAKRTRQNEGQPVTEEALDGVAAVGEPAANGGQVIGNDDCLITKFAYTNLHICNLGGAPEILRLCSIFCRRLGTPLLDE